MCIVAFLFSPTDVEELRTQEDEMEVTSRKRKNASKKSQIFSSDETKATKNKLPAPVENYKSKSQTPEKFNADNFSSRSQGAGVACDCVPSNVSSLETNIIENTEEIEVARFKPKLNCPTTRKGAAEKDKALKSKEGRTGKLDKSETTALTDSCQAGKSIGPDVRNTIESIATSPSPVKHKKSELPARPVSMSLWCFHIFVFVVQIVVVILHFWLGLKVLIRWISCYLFISVLLNQWFSKWSISTPKGQLDHPRGQKQPRGGMGVNK